MRSKEAKFEAFPTALFTAMAIYFSFRGSWLLACQTLAMAAVNVYLWYRARDLARREG